MIYFNGEYRNKPVVIDAIRFNGQWNPIRAWLQELAGPGLIFKPGLLPPITMNEDDSLSIQTLEGTMRAELGDWIICGVAGELYPCKPDIFDATYSAAE